MADLPSIWLPLPSAEDPPFRRHPLLSWLLRLEKTELTDIETRLDLEYCVLKTDLAIFYGYLATLIRTVGNLYQTHTRKYLISYSYRVWKVMMLKAHWGGEHSLFPQYPASFGLTQAVPAHPAQPSGHPDKRIDVCESLDTL